MVNHKHVNCSAYRPTASAVVILVLLLTPPVCAQNQPSTLLSLSLTPGIGVPFDPILYSVGGGVHLRILIPIDTLRFLEPQGGLGYAFVPVNAAASITLLRAFGGVNALLPIGASLILNLVADAGYFFGRMNLPGGTMADGFFYGAGISGTFLTAPDFWVGVEARYNDYLGLYRELGLSLTTRLRLRKREAGTGGKP